MIFLCGKPYIFICMNLLNKLYISDADSPLQASDLLGPTDKKTPEGPSEEVQPSQISTIPPPPPLPTGNKSPGFLTR